MIRGLFIFQTTWTESRERDKKNYKNGHRFSGNKLNIFCIENYVNTELSDSKLNSKNRCFMLCKVDRGQRKVYSKVE